MPRILTLLGATVAVVSGCVSGGSGRSAPAPVAAAPSAPTVNTTGPWRVTAPSGLEKVTITTQAVVSIAGDTSTRTDSVRATLGASYTWTGVSPRKVDGLLSDYRVALDTAVPMPPAGLQFPRPYSAFAKSVSSGMTFTLPAETSACTDPTLSALQGLQDAWVEVPGELRVGAEWVDTVQTLSCRDRVPLHGTSVRRFQVKRGEVRDGGRVVVIIERTARGRLLGDGEQFGEKIAIRGESSGTMRYELDPVTGRFVQANGESSLTFSLVSSRRHQQVRQASRLLISW